jgi:hypothetical protein
MAKKEGKRNVVDEDKMKGSRDHGLAHVLVDGESNKQPATHVLGFAQDDPLPADQ